MTTHSEARSSRLEEAIAAALARLERAELTKEGRVRLLNFVRRNLETSGYEPQEELVAQRLFDVNTTAIRNAVKLFERKIAPEREKEALASLLEFMQPAYHSLENADFAEVERQLVSLGHARNRFSVPRQPLSLDEQIRRAIAVGWTGEEVDLLLTELRRDGGTIGSVDPSGVTASSGRRIDRAKLREDGAPLVEPYRSKFFARLPAIPTDRH